MARQRRNGRLMSVAAIALLAAAGCASRSGPRGLEGEIRVTASVRVQRSESPPAEPPQPVLLELPEEFQGEGRAAYPIDSSGEIGRTAFARVEARRRSLRALGSHILNHRLADERRFAEFIEHQEGWDTRLSECLETQATVEFEELDVEARAVATVRGADVARALGLELGQSLSAPRDEEAAAGLSAEQRRRTQAREAALAGARQLLYERLIEVETSEGPLRRHAYRSRSVNRRLRDMIDSTEPYEVEFTEDGKCRVTLVFDTERVAELVP